MAGDTVTVLEGATFCVASTSGDIVAGTTQGVFFLDARILSELSLTVNGSAPEPLAAEVAEPFHATFVSRAGETLVVERNRYLGDGMREDIVVRNVGGEPAYLRVEVAAAADFASPADVREDRAPAVEVASTVDDDGTLVLAQRRGGTTGLRGMNGTMGVRLQCQTGDGRPGHLEPGRAAFEAIVRAGGRWTVCVEVIPVVDGDQVEPRHRCGEPIERADPAERRARWRRGLPQVTTDHADLAAVLATSADDLGALRVFDPDVPERVVVAAGVPWSMGLHARDALLTAWMALLVDPDLALGVLETLARFQGTDVDPRTEEEPGRILHAMRFGASTVESARSYGAVDTTPLFVMLLGELRRWGLAPELVDRLLPHADAALAWIVAHGDRDGDGWVEYERATDRGRRHQGWRDTDEGLRGVDGRLGRPPIAPAETQACVYAAFVARSHFARETGDEAGERAWRGRAEDLRQRFRRDFWLDDRGYPALALDHEKRPLDALGSHLGFCLWTGLLDGEEAAAAAKHLLSDELFTGFGIRTLGASTPGVNPLGYHHGAVWPHDTAIAAAGLMRYGFVEESLRVLGGLLDAAVAFGGRLPEVFAGFDRDEVAFPVRLPRACA
ncbi:MAG: glycogen debranching N-terminal domain-containing protein, partial [Acidimicrobiales bacterium]